MYNSQQSSIHIIKWNSYSATMYVAFWERGISPIFWQMKGGGVECAMKKDTNGFKELKTMKMGQQEQKSNRKL